MGWVSPARRGMWRPGEQVDHEDLIRAATESGAGQIKCGLGSNVPVTAERMAVDPDCAIAEIANVEKGVGDNFLAGFDLECSAIESGSGHGVGIAAIFEARFGWRSGRIGDRSGFHRGAGKYSSRGALRGRA